MKKTVVIILILIPFFSFSQEEIVHFISTRYNWGDMISTQFPPTVFKFINQGTKPLTILNSHADYEVKISYPHTFIAPNDTGILYVKYESNSVGPFSKIIEVNFNLIDTPIKLLIEGNNVSAISCFPDAKDWTRRKVCVIDSVTKEQVKEEVNCKFFCYTTGKTIQFKTDKEGKAIVILPIGMYAISLESNGYKTTELSQNIPKTAPVLFFEMAKAKTVKPVSVPDIQTSTSHHVSETINESNSSVFQNSDEELPKELYRSNNIVFLIDISKSMQSNHRLEKLKQCMDVLINALRDNDIVTIVVYNTQPRVLIESENGLKHSVLTTTIDTLSPTGFTNSVSGLEMAYSFAKKYFVNEGNYQIILATDGEFTGSSMSEQQMMTLVAENAERGIIISIVGFAETKDIIGTLQNMARLGHGSFIQINDQLDQRLLIDEIKSKSSVVKKDKQY